MDETETTETRGEKFVRVTIRSFDLDPSERAILGAVADAIDSYDAAIERVAAEGSLIADRFGAPQVHPMLAWVDKHRRFILNGLTSLRLSDPARPLAQAVLDGDLDLEVD